MTDLLVTKLLDAIVDSLDIPESYYEKAVDRHRSLGQWLCRPESKVAAFQPNVSPSGFLPVWHGQSPTARERGVRPRQRYHARNGEDRDDPKTTQATLRRRDQRVRNVAWHGGTCRGD